MIGTVGDMELTSEHNIKKLFAKYQAYPIKQLGQHFLVSKSALEKIIQAASLSPEDIVLEVGPGIGTLTKKLAEKAKKVIAVEKDTKMVKILKETLRGVENLKIIQADILQATSIPQATSYKLIGNLPYNIATVVIRKFLEAKNPPQMMLLTIQKEVAQRICAKPPKMSILAVSVQFYAEPVIVSYIPRTAFWPQPKVDSAIIKIIPRKSALLSASTSLEIPTDIVPSLPHRRTSNNNIGRSPFEVSLRGLPRRRTSNNNVGRSPFEVSLRGLDTESLTGSIRFYFFKIVKAGFSHPRKQLINNLSQGLKIKREKVKSWLEQNNIDPRRRAETLRVEDWLRLTTG